MAAARAYQNLRKSGWPLCHHSSTTLPTMLVPLIGPQYRLSQEIGAVVAHHVELAGRDPEGCWLLALGIGGPSGSWCGR